MKNFYSLLLTFMGVFVFSQVGTLCDNPIIIGTLPYSTTDDTANYADNYDPSTSSSPTCSTSSYGNYYHGGNDVIYAYTAQGSGTIKIELSAVAWTGVFVYNSCSDIGVTYAACSTSPFAGTRTIDNFPVIEGQTYYIYVSSWPSPQTFAYTLNITPIVLSVNENVSKDEQTIIYPNPVHDVINFKASSEIIKATIYSFDGKKVRSVNVSKNTMSVEELPKGAYIIEFMNKNNDVYTKKFIKK